MTKKEWVAYCLGVIRSSPDLTPDEKAAYASAKAAVRHQDEERRKAQTDLFQA